jgi:hypothetical protein
MMLASCDPAWWAPEDGVVKLQKNGFGVSRIIQNFSVIFK